MQIGRQGTNGVILIEDAPKRQYLQTVGITYQEDITSNYENGTQLMSNKSQLAIESSQILASGIFKQKAQKESLVQLPTKTEIPVLATLRTEICFLPHHPRSNDLQKFWQGKQHKNCTNIKGDQNETNI